MARLAITFAALLFLFTFAGARLHVYSTGNDVNNNQVDSSESMPDADLNPTLLLPSDKSDQSADESSAPSAEVETVDVNDLVHVTLPEPAEFVTFRPVNRHFPTNRQFPLRYTRRRPCRHLVRPMNDRSREISYGNDMILSSNMNDGRDPELLFRDQIIPSMALRFQRNNHRQNHHNHNHNQNQFMSKYVFARDKLKRPFRREDEEKERENKGENSGIVKRFRKFLNHF